MIEIDEQASGSRALRYNVKPSREFCRWILSGCSGYLFDTPGPTTCVARSSVFLVDTMLQDTVSEVHRKLRAFQSEGKSIFASSSFQTHSIPILHILSRFDRDIPIYFIDTGFHFPETRSFRDHISELLQLNLVIIDSPVPKIAQRDDNGDFLFASNPDRCCYFNKVLPLEPVLMKFDVWVSGVRRDQTAHRMNLDVVERGIHDTLRYYPMLDWTAKMIWDYRQQFHLPEHPLEAAGYLSVGCAPCTRKFHDSLEARAGRWTGMTKEECGIHTEFSQK
jgi:phosphoadenosine phosphosulfate reductase